MTNLVNRLRSCMPPDCFATRCRRDGCLVDLKEAPRPNVLLNMDAGLVGESDAKCDYIFVGGANNTWVVPIELKKGDAKISDVVKQLRAGARFVEKMCLGTQVQFVPVLASGSMHKAQRAELMKDRNKIGFRTDDTYIRRIRCGGLLTSALS